MKYFPVYIDLENAPVLVAGGGEAAAQKIRLLLKTDAQIDVIAHELNVELAALEKEGRINFLPGSFHGHDLKKYRLIYASTGCALCDRELSDKAHALGININIVDHPDLCNFITPAIVDRSPITVAIGTEGVAPVLAREIKAKLEALLPWNYGRLGEVARKFRVPIQDRIKNASAKRRFWEALFEGSFRDLVLRGQEAKAERHLEDWLEEVERTGDGAQLPDDASSVGQVALVGCGPGDTDLLTLKAQQRLQSADVLVVDRLVNPDILEYARRDAKRIYVGKTPGGPSVAQEEINRILLREALAGQMVVRLKGGDPFIFGRAVEEMSALQVAGIPVEIVPGITSAQACAASIGLPLTSRGKTRKFTFLTGATADDIATKDWLPNVEEGEAAAVYMGVRTAPLIQNRMMMSGLPGNTPVVIVEKGTRKDERVIETNLSNLETCINAADINGPAIIFLGLDWEGIGLKRPEKVEVFETENIVQLASRRNARKSDEA